MTASSATPDGEALREMVVDVLELLEIPTDKWFMLYQRVAELKDSTPSAIGRGTDAMNALRRLHEAVAAIGAHGFDKDTTKDPEAFLRWRMLNDAQAAAKKLLEGQ